MTLIANAFVITWTALLWWETVDKDKLKQVKTELAIIFVLYSVLGLALWYYATTSGNQLVIGYIDRVGLYLQLYIVLRLITSRRMV